MLTKIVSILSIVVDFFLLLKKKKIFLSKKDVAVKK